MWRMLGGESCCAQSTKSPVGRIKSLRTACQGMCALLYKDTVSHTHTCPAAQHHTLCGLPAEPGGDREGNVGQELGFSLCNWAPSGLTSLIPVVMETCGPQI